MGSLVTDLQNYKRSNDRRVRSLTMKETVKCREHKCNFETKGLLSIHIAKTHKMTKVQYLAKHNLPINAVMYGSEYHSRSSKNSAFHEYHRKRKGEKNEL